MEQLTKKLLQDLSWKPLQVLLSSIWCLLLISDCCVFPSSPFSETETLFILFLFHHYILWRVDFFSLSLQIVGPSRAISEPNKSTAPRSPTLRWPQQLDWLCILSLGRGQRFYVWEVVAEGILGRPEGWTVAIGTNLFSPSSAVEQLGRD